MIPTRQRKLLTCAGSVVFCCALLFGWRYCLALQQTSLKASSSSVSWALQPVGKPRYHSRMDELLATRKPRVTEQLTKGELIDAFGTLLAWEDNKYSVAQWDQEILLAKKVQGADPRIVADAMDDYLRERYRALSPFVKTGSGNAFINDPTKLQILLRVMFVVPDKESWPLSWSHGRPQIIPVNYGGLEQEYDAAAEYIHFFTTYPMRRWDEKTK